MSDLWAFLGDQSNRDILTWIGGALAAIAGGVWAVAKFFVGSGRRAARPPGGTIRADHGGIAGGGDISIRTTTGLSGSHVVLLVLGVAGALMLAAGLFGDRIAVSNGAYTGGNVNNSEITVQGGAERNTP